MNDKKIFLHFGTQACTDAAISLYTFSRLRVFYLNQCPIPDNSFHLFDFVQRTNDRLSIISVKGFELMVAADKIDTVIIAQNQTSISVVRNLPGFECWLLNNYTTKVHVAKFKEVCNDVSD